MLVNEEERIKLLINNVTMLSNEQEVVVKKDCKNIDEEVKSLRYKDILFELGMLLRNL